MDARMILHDMVREVTENYSWEGYMRILDYATENNIDMGEMYTDAEGRERGEVTGYWVEDDYYLFPQFR